MSHNGMTEEEYLDSLLRQASNDMPKEDTVNDDEKTIFNESEQIKDKQAENNIDLDTVFDFENIIEDSAEAEIAPAEGVAQDNINSVDDETDFLDVFFDNMENEMESITLDEEAANEEVTNEEAFSEEVTNEEAFNEETLNIETFNEESLDEEQLNEENNFEDFHRTLDSVIDELENDNISLEDNIDIFSQIDNTELSEEELEQDIDDMSLLEAVGMLLNEEQKAQEKQHGFDGLASFDIESVSENKKEKSLRNKERRPKKEYFKKLKTFLEEQGEDTEEDIAAQEAKDAAKEAKKQKEEEDKEKKEEEKAAKREQAEKDKAAKKEAKQGKALERQMKKEQKKAERENSGETKYNVNIIKLTLLFTIVAASGILLWAISDFNYRRISKKNAMIYFTANQYELAYDEIAGLEPRKSDVVFFEQVQTVMYVLKQYNSYLSFYNIGMKEEALNSLLKGIDKYDKYYETADELGILDDMNSVLDKIYEALEESYNLSAEKANEIANIEDSADYSVALRMVIEGTY